VGFRILCFTGLGGRASLVFASTEWAERSMSSIKEKMTQIIQAQPEDATYEEIMRDLAFERMTEQGLLDSRSGRVVSNEEMERRIRTWRK
jgi:hypothetical protein